MKNRDFVGYETGIAIVGGLTVAFAIVLAVRMFSPVICERAGSQLQSDITVICNEAVLDYIDSSNLKYTDIISIERSADGNIRAMNTEIANVNRMKSGILLDIQRKIDEIEEIGVTFPINGFFGFGGGIEIPVKLISVECVEAELEPAFESVGINQTRLDITLKVKASGKLLLAGQDTEVEVATDVPIAQTIIVGDVPDTYLNVEKNSD